MLAAWACFTSVVIAQDDLSLASADPIVGAKPPDDLRITAITPNSFVMEPHHDLSFLNDLELSLRVPFKDPNTSFDGLTFNHTNNLLVIEYKGLEGLVAKHCVKQMRRYYEEILQSLWDNSSLHPMDLDERVQYFRRERNPFEIRWWERRWFDSFPKEKGGAGVLLITKGTNLEILEVGPLVLSNSGKLSWSEWKAELFEEYESLAQLKQERNMLAWQADPTATRPIRDLSFGLILPNGNIAEGKAWSLSGTLRLNLKANGTDLNGNRSAIRGNLEFRCYSRGKQWLDAELRVTGRPLDQDYSAELVIGLLYF